MKSLVNAKLNVRSLLALALIALSFTTGFTCSKNTPTEAPQQQSAPAQEQMAAPQAPAPTEAPAATEAAPAGAGSATEAAPTAAPETK